MVINDIVDQRKKKDFLKKIDEVNRNISNCFVGFCIDHQTMNGEKYQILNRLKKRVHLAL